MPHSSATATHHTGPLEPAVRHHEGQHSSAPLSTINLLRAGVPAGEVNWYSTLRPADQMIALQSTRGSLLLERVRRFVAGGATTAAIAA
jgi:hypothetical protein